MTQQLRMSTIFMNLLIPHAPLSFFFFFFFGNSCSSCQCNTELPLYECGNWPSSSTHVIFHSSLRVTVEEPKTLKHIFFNLHGIAENTIDSAQTNFHRVSYISQSSLAIYFNPSIPERLESSLWPALELEFQNLHILEYWQMWFTYLNMHAYNQSMSAFMAKPYTRADYCYQLLIHLAFALDQRLAFTASPTVRKNFSFPILSSRLANLSFCRTCHPGFTIATCNYKIEKQ